MDQPSIERENKKIKNRYLGLLRDLKNTCSKEDLKEIRKAFNIALEAHKKMRRENQEPFIFHPLGVARILSKEIGLGKTSIICALVHETVKTKYISLDEIEKEFGGKVAQIINGLTKIESIDTQTKLLQAENFRKLIITMADDVRVILIKLADRLDNIRIANYYSPEKQIKMASETSFLYAPLAHRLGLYNMKSELEDLCMKYLEKEAYKNIVKNLSETKTQRDNFIRSFIKPIKEKLQEQNLDFEIKGRPKSVSSIWAKMKKQGVKFDEVYDKFAIRIIINSKTENEKTDCWKAYSIVTDKYTPNTERLRDWISVPKSNGYESLHTTVIGANGKWVEVQIRSLRMNEIAERGLAAHWKYKGVEGDTQGIDSWFEQVRGLIENPERNAIDLLNDFKLNLYQDEVFVFTPNGDLRRLPSGSTVLDFAYDIHTQVGSKCIGAKINHKNVTIKQELCNGDHIEIITSKNQMPRRDWLNFVITSKARHGIKQTLREFENKEAEKGKELLIRRLKNWKLSYSDESLWDIFKHFKYKSAQDFYTNLINEKIDILDIKNFLTKKNIQQEKAQENQKIEKTIQKQTGEHSDLLIIDQLIKNVDYKLSKCCNPIYGDDIFGFVTIGEGIKIHRTNCPNAKQLLSKYDYRILKTQWTETNERNSFQTSIRISGYDEIGIISNITDIISKDLKVNMRSISVKSFDEMFEGEIQLYVEGVEHLNFLIRKIQNISGITKVYRETH